MHYSLFLRHSAKDVWIYLDDSIVKERIREQIHSKTVFLLFGFLSLISRKEYFFVLRLKSLADSLKLGSELGVRLG